MQYEKEPSAKQYDEMIEKRKPKEEEEETINEEESKTTIKHNKTFGHRSRQWVLL